MVKYIAFVFCVIVEYSSLTSGQFSGASSSGISDIMRDLTTLRNLLLIANQNIYTLQSQFSIANQNIHTLQRQHSIASQDIYTLQSQLVVANKEISSLKQETAQYKTEIDELKHNQTYYLTLDLTSNTDGINRNRTALQTDQISLLHDVDDIRKTMRKTNTKFDLLNRTSQQFFKSELLTKNNTIAITSLQQKFVQYVNRMNATIKQQQRNQEQQSHKISSLSSSVASLQLSGKDNFLLYIYLCE